MTAPVSRPPLGRRLAAGDMQVWQIGLLALLIVVVLLPQSLRAIALGLWGGAALLFRRAGDGPWPARDLARYTVPLLAYAILVAPGLIGQIAWTGAALAPVTLLLLTALLPRPDTAPAARDWAGQVAGVLWAALGVLALAGLATLPELLGSAAVVVLAGLLAYTAGRRAGLIQGLSERVAIGMGTTLALSAPIMLSTGLQALGMVLGVVGGLVLANLAPAPPVVSRPYYSAVIAVQHQLLFVAPLTVVILWLVRTFL
jgi:hypothetical protein